MVPALKFARVVENGLEVVPDPRETLFVRMASLKSGEAAIRKRAVVGAPCGLALA